MEDIIIEDLLEFIVFEDLDTFGVIELRVLEILEGLIDFDIGFNFDEFLAKEGLFLILDKFLADILRGDLVDILVDIFEVMIFLEECLGSFWTDSGYSGDIIGLIAHEGKEVDDIFGVDAPFGFNLFAVIFNNLAGSFFGDTDFNILGDELQDIFIACEDIEGEIF